MNLSLNMSIFVLKSFFYSVMPVQLILQFLVTVLADICISDLWGKSKINDCSCFLKYQVISGNFFFLLLSLMHVSSLSLRIISFLFKNGVFPLSFSLGNANGMESKHELFCVLCQEYCQILPEQPPRNQTKDQIELPNLHGPWKFWLVQQSVSTLSSEQRNTYAVTTAWKVCIFQQCRQSNCYIS